jgi:hypothetical protein
MTFLSSLTYSSIWWYDDFIKKPISFGSYFQENHLPPDLLVNETLYANSANIMNGQGFKARYDLHEQLRNSMEYKFGDGGYFITDTLINLRQFQTESGIKLDFEPIYLNWLEWWVVKLP